jgi:hypothetical protein
MCESSSITDGQLAVSRTLFKYSSKSLNIDEYEFCQAVLGVPWDPSIPDAFGGGLSRPTAPTPSPIYQ